MTPFLPVIGNDTEKIQRMEAGESTPLLVTTPPATVMTSGTTTTTSATGGEGSSRIMSEMPEVCRRELIVTTGAGIGFICNAISMVLSTHPIIMVTSILGLLVTPFAAFQQKKITQARALAQTNQVLAEQVQRLNQETNRLQAQEKQLASSVVCLQGLERSLEEIQALGGVSVEELERQLQDAKQILRGFERNVKANLLQNLMTVILTMDRDGNMILCDEEIDELIHALEGIQGAQMNEERFRKVIIDQGRCIYGVMDVARTLLSDDTPMEETIFTLFDPDTK